MSLKLLKSHVNTVSKYGEYVSNLKVNALDPCLLGILENAEHLAAFSQTSTQNQPYQKIRNHEK